MSSLKQEITEAWAEAFDKPAPSTMTAVELTLQDKVNQFWGEAFSKPPVERTLQDEITKARQQLAKIEVILDELEAQDNVHFGHVGDAGHITEELASLVRFLRG